MKKYEGLYHYDDCGLDNIYLKGGVFVSAVDGEECFSITDLEGLHKVIALNLVKQQSPLSNKEFRFLRIELDLTQKELAEKFGCDVQTIANYEKGKSAIPKLEDLALRELYKEGLFRKIINEMRSKKQLSAKPKRAVFEMNRTWHSKDKKAA